MKLYRNSLAVNILFCKMFFSAPTKKATEHLSLLKYFLYFKIMGIRFERFPILIKKFLFTKKANTRHTVNI